MSSSGALSQAITAGDAHGLNVVLGETNEAISKGDVDIYDYVTGKKFISIKNVSVQNKKISISSESLEAIIKRAGKYVCIFSSGELS